MHNKTKQIIAIIFAITLVAMYSDDNFAYHDVVPRSHSANGQKKYTVSRSAQSRNCFTGLN
ncbi:MAG: hypothetical protein FWH04_04970 [Oscillospiraceae bacterium]|nr:hypothetical protein [Oscillospiraceae bacterium]